MAKIPRPSHQTVVAYLALLIALGTGGAWAAQKLGSKDIAKNAIHSKHIKRNQVLGKHIKNGAITAPKIVDGPGSGLDADTLDGIGLGGLLASDRVLYGRAPSSADEALLIRWPGTGVEVRTHDGGAGDSLYHLRISNTNPPGGPSFRVNDVGSSSGPLNPGETEKYGGLSGADLLLIENKGSLGRMMSLHCFANVIGGGDDGFFQCMGLTAGAP